MPSAGGAGVRRLGGGRSASLPYAREQLTFSPAAELSVSDDSGHWPHADNPERFADVVVPFLRRAHSG
jgi:pimeloyl-ACP methyl ester carboxylesterase